MILMMIPMMILTMTPETIQGQDQEKEKKEDEMVFHHTVFLLTMTMTMTTKYSTPQTWNTGICRDQG
jgi:hypothetical protein